jgi:hypothetical protein
MALPKLEVPTYELELPLSKKTIKYRPFLVKEQKNLLMAMESGDAKTIQQNVRDILDICTMTKDVDIDELSIIDVEYYFINLRAKSVGEVSETKYRCNNEVEDKTCNNIMEVKINLLDIKPEYEEEPVNPEIQLTDKVSVKMRFPPFKLIKNSVDLDDIVDVTFNMLAQSIEYIYDGEQFHYSKDEKPEDMVDFVENLSQEQFDKLEAFFNSIPKLRKTVDVKCSKCGFEHKLHVEGLESFFA